jgi:hypothetical protein
MKKLSKYLPLAEMQAEFEQYKKLKTEAERSAFQEERAKRLEKIPDNERTAYVKAANVGLQATLQTAEELITTINLGDIAKAVSLSYIATTYFGKSRSWLYQRLNGHTVNGKKAQFSPEEKKQFALALKDLSIQLHDTSLKFG